VDGRKTAYALYDDDGNKRQNLPKEFVAAAYRFGHSQVRTGYRLNGTKGKAGGTRINIFPSSEDTSAPTDSLLGFDPLPKEHVIDDWARFFSSQPWNEVPSDNTGPVSDQPGDGAVRLQYAYKIDPTIVDPLGVLPKPIAGAGPTAQAKAQIAPDKLPDPGRPSLALLNLLRGNAYRIHGGQDYANILKSKGKPVPPLDKKYLVTRQPDGDGKFKFVRIDPVFDNDTPLWFYILAEAQAPLVDALTGTFDEDKLLHGRVGGRIVAEVFYGLLDSDPESFVHAPSTWTPKLGGNGKPILANLLRFAGLPVDKH
jgi:hypothetical protein